MTVGSFLAILVVGAAASRGRCLLRTAVFPAIAGTVTRAVITGSTGPVFAGGEAVEDDFEGRNFEAKRGL